MQLFSFAFISLRRSAALLDFSCRCQLYSSQSSSREFGFLHNSAGYIIRLSLSFASSCRSGRMQTKLLNQCQVTKSDSDILKQASGTNFNHTMAGNPVAIDPAEYFVVLVLKLWTVGCCDFKISYADDAALVQFER